MKSTKRSGEFKALELKLSEETESPHFIYFKEHAVREQNVDKPSGRTLFVVNVPPYVDEEAVKNAFSEAGTITSVSLMLKPTGAQEKPLQFIPETTTPSFRIGYVVFSKVSELDKALKLKKLKPINHNGYKVKTGLAKWIEEYNNNICHRNSLKAKVDDFITKFDKTLKKSEEKKKMEEEDEEGWVTVTRKGKVNSFARSEKVENKIMAKEERGKKRKELQNFYTFQIRESKMKHIVALRQKFEEDKKKIAQIKESRRFKPF